MVTQRRRTPERRVDLDELTREQAMHLHCGWVLPINEYPFVDDDHRRTTWERYQDQILSVHIGTRPQAWWDFEAEEPRKLLSGTAVSYACGPRGEVQEQFEFTPELKEIPPRKFWNWKGQPGSCGVQLYPIWETELEYLERLGLANPGERQEAIKAATEAWLDRYKMYEFPPAVPEEAELLQDWDKH